MLQSTWDTYRVLFDVFAVKDGVPLGVMIAFAVITALALIACSVIDIQKMIIPDVITYPGIIISALLSFVLWDNPTIHIIGGIVAGLFFLSLAFVKIRGNFALGFGDVKLYAWLGFVFAQAVLPIMLLASIIGLLTHGLYRLVVSMRRKGETNGEEVDPHFPHGPHIVAASFIVAAICIVVS